MIEIPNQIEDLLEGLVGLLIWGCDSMNDPYNHMARGVIPYLINSPNSQVRGV